MQGKATLYVVMKQTVGVSGEQVGVYTNRAKATKAADIAHYREPDRDWWVESRTVIWHHEGEPQA